MPPPPPTAETVLSELHPIAVKWKELGEALEVPEHTLDNISTEGSDPVRLHDMIHYYFSTPHPHSWEEIVRALGEIGETEAADRIVRTRNLVPGECSNSLVMEQKAIAVFCVLSKGPIAGGVLIVRRK